MKTVVTGQEKLFKALRKLAGPVANKILRTELRAATKEVAADIKPIAPVGGRPNNFGGRSRYVRPSENRAALHSWPKIGAS